MPTNLPADYYKVEELYKAATTPEEKVHYLEELISTIPKHKGTDHLRADLRRRLSKLKEAVETRKSSGRRDSPYHISKEGAGQVVIIGPANVGKSSLVTAVTNANPDIADYPYTTQIPIPGMMPIDNIKVQLIDTPPLSEEYADPQLLGLIRRADMVLLMVDLQAYPIEQIEQTIALLDENRIVPEHLRAQTDPERRVRFIPLQVVVNKVDDEVLDQDFEALCELYGEGCPLIPISAKGERNLDKLKQIVFEQLGIIRVYSKPPGKEPDRSRPFILKHGSTVEDFAAKVHQDFVKRLKSARVWGSAQHDGQMAGRDYVLHDEDVVELRL
jgi:small GTP-binding protein